MFDINSIQSTLTADMPVRHPKTGLPVGPTIVIRSSDHPARQLASAELAREGLKLGELSSEDKFAERSEQIVRYLVACIETWSGLAEGKKELPFSVPAARKLLAKPEMAWLRTQIFMELSKEENFIQASGTDSVATSSTTSA